MRIVSEVASVGTDGVFAQVDIPYEGNTFVCIPRKLDAVNEVYYQIELLGQDLVLFASKSMDDAMLLMKAMRIFAQSECDYLILTDDCDVVQALMDAANQVFLPKIQKENLLKDLEEILG